MHVYKTSKFLRTENVGSGEGVQAAGAGTVVPALAASPDRLIDTMIQHLLPHPFFGRKTAPPPPPPLQDRETGKVTHNTLNNQRINGLKYWATINDRRSRIGQRKTINGISF